jgi:beta-phosphoglucomutase
MVPIGILTQFSEQELKKAGSKMVFPTLLEAYQYLKSLP